MGAMQEFKDWMFGSPDSFRIGLVLLATLGIVVSFVAGQVEKSAGETDYLVSKFLDRFLLWRLLMSKPAQILAFVTLISAVATNGFEAWR